VTVSCYKFNLFTELHDLKEKIVVSLEQGWSGEKGCYPEKRQ